MEYYIFFSFHNHILANSSFNEKNPFLMHKLSFLVIIIIGFQSCESTNNSISSKTKTYKNEEVGWTFNYPGDWKVLSNDEIQMIELGGSEAIEKTLGQEIESTNNNLLYLQKDENNTFTSTLNSFDPAIDGSYSENQQSIFQIIIETYRNQGIQFDYKVGNTEVDGLEFATFESTLYAPETKDVLFNQIIYDRLINNNTSLSFSLNYVNDQYKQQLMGIVETSKFTKRQ